jgi:hypothetical protein
MAFVRMVTVDATESPAPAVVTAASGALPAARCGGQRADGTPEASPEVGFRRFCRNWLGNERASTGSHNVCDQVVVTSGQKVNTVFCRHQLKCFNPTVNV